MRIFLALNIHDACQLRIDMWGRSKTQVARDIYKATQVKVIIYLKINILHLLARLPVKHRHASDRRPK